MADYTVSYESGLTLYSLVFDPSGNAWNGTAFVDRSANWAACALPMVDGGMGVYSGTMPATLTSGTYLVQSYLQLGAGPVETDNLVGTGSVEWVNTASSSPIDLITGTYASQVLAAGGVTLTAAQSAILGNLITAASREIIRFCNRKFAMQTYTEILTPEGGRQDRREPDTAKLSAFPVQSIASVLTGRAGVLTVKNTNTSTNQFASVAFGIEGDIEYLDLQYTGLVLSRTASGVTTSNTVYFASNPTLQDIANAVNALGNGWNATVQATYQPYPSALLVGVREPKNALSNGACLDMFTQTPASGSYDVDRKAGIFRCYGWAWGNGLGGFFGDPNGGSFDGFGGGWNGWGGGQFQVVYQGGFTTVPADIQQVCAEVVKGIYARLNVDPSLKSESADKYSYVARDVIETLTDDARNTLTKYKDGWL